MQDVCRELLPRSDFRAFHFDMNQLYAIHRTVTSIEMPFVRGSLYKETARAFRMHLSRSPREPPRSRPEAGRRST